MQIEHFKEAELLVDITEHTLVRFCCCCCCYACMLFLYDVVGN